MVIQGEGNLCENDENTHGLILIWQNYFLERMCCERRPSLPYYRY